MKNKIKKLQRVRKRCRANKLRTDIQGFGTDVRMEQSVTRSDKTFKAPDQKPTRLKTTQTASLHNDQRTGVTQNQQTQLQKKRIPSSTDKCRISRKS